MTTVRLLSPTLTAQNPHEVLAGAVHKTKREVEEMATRLRPRPDVPSAVRKLPERRTAAVPAVLLSAPSLPASLPSESPCVAQHQPSSATRAVASPLAPERYRIQFTAGRETELGIYTFAELNRASNVSASVAATERLRNLMEEIEPADQVGLDVFGVGEHHRPDYVVSAPAVVLARVPENEVDPALMATSPRRHSGRRTSSSLRTPR